MKLRQVRDLSHTEKRPKRAELSALGEARFKLTILGIVFLIAYSLIAFRLIELGFYCVMGTKIDSYSSPFFQIKRANIIDVRGTTIATNLITASVFAKPKELLDIDEVAKKLPSVLTNLNSKEIRKKLDKRKDFVWLARNITPLQQMKILKLGLPGIDFFQEEKRMYPHGSIGAHIIGFTDVDNKGLAGIERFFNEQLLNSDTVVQLTIDMRIQTAVENEIFQAVKKFKANGGNSIVMDANTGEILAMATFPTYNPNLPSKIKKETLFDSNTLGVYDLGSIFKIFTAAIALDTKKITLEDGYDATNPIRIAGFTISDYLGGEKRWLSIPEIILYSSNIGSAKMAMDAGTQAQKSFFKRLGFFEKVPIELLELSTPILSQSWGDVATMTISYGYGLAVSPLHIVRGFAALVNGGYLVKPTLIKANISPIKTQVISETTSKDIRRLLHLVVQKGTSKKARIPGYFVGGKTGTAEKRNVGGKGFLKKANITSFLGAFPIHKPKYIIYVQLDDPKGVKETHGFRAAGWNAAPTASAIIKRIIPLLNILPEDENDPSIHKFLNINLSPKVFSSSAG